MDKTKAKHQLGMDHGTAASKLRKMILFSLIQRLGLNICYRCSNTITSCRELSVEHKIPWLHAKDAVKLFFDLNNITFSHLACNVSAARKFNKKYFTDEEKLEARRRLNREREKRRYTTEKRQEKYKRIGQ